MTVHKFFNYTCRHTISLNTRSFILHLPSNDSSTSSRSKFPELEMCWHIYISVYSNFCANKMTFKGHQWLFTEMLFLFLHEFRKIIQKYQSYPKSRKSNHLNRKIFIIMSSLTHHYPRIPLISTIVRFF